MNFSGKWAFALHAHATVVTSHLNRAKSYRVITFFYYILLILMVVLLHLVIAFKGRRSGCTIGLGYNERSQADRNPLFQLRTSIENADCLTCNRKKGEIFTILVYFYGKKKSLELLSLCFDHFNH